MRTRLSRSREDPGRSLEVFSRIHSLTCRCKIGQARAFFSRRGLQTKSTACCQGGGLVGARVYGICATMFWDVGEDEGGVLPSLAIVAAGRLSAEDCVHMPNGIDC